MKFRYCLMVGLLALATASWGNERELRKAIREEIEEAYKQENFARIEQRYAEFSRQTARLPSGVLKSARILYVLSDVSSTRGTRNPSAASTPAEVLTIWKLHDEKTARWQKAFPTSSVAAFTRSMIFIDQAYYFRGGGAAREVEPEGWEGFRKNIARAAEALAEPALIRDPAWYWAALRIAQYGSMSLEKYVELLLEGTTRFPHYYDLYFWAADKLQPRWGGSYEALEWLADLAVKNTQAEDGQAAYARVYWSASSYGELNDHLFSASHADWKKMKRGFDDMVRRYPSDWNLNHYARYACLARDQQTLRSVFERLGTNIDRSIWYPLERLNRCRNFARDGE